MSNGPHPNQYPPPQWDSQPPRGAYPPPPEGLHYVNQGRSPYPQGPPLGPHQGDMISAHPHAQHHEMYPYSPYAPNTGPPSHMPYPPQHAQHRDPQQPPHMNFPNTPAPRQRTAIACRYCRRRKAHAFVPAHTAYPHLRNNNAQAPQPPGGARPMYSPDGQPMIYSAHGQPYPHAAPPNQDPNYHSHPGYNQAPYPPSLYDDRNAPTQQYAQDPESRKRPRVEEPPSSYPPPSVSATSHPYPQQQRQNMPTGTRRESGSTATTSQYEYPDPTGLAPVSPASSTTSYQSQQYPPGQGPQPYYPNQQSARRTSPQTSSYSYDTRGSGSPPYSSTSTPNAVQTGGLHPPQVLPPREAGRTPPPGQARDPGSNGARAGGMSVRDLLGPDGGSRSSADNSMVNALNRKGM
ncbi:hypothetical protein MMC25_002396 [Agyrium rufum]|nr:hypothetical protein [Agyrium rufum]